MGSQVEGEASHGRVSLRSAPAWQWAKLHIAKLKARLTKPVLRRVWRLLTLISVIGVMVSSFYAWDRLQAQNVQFAPSYAGLAAAVYIATYGARLLGWHAVATYFFGRLPLQVNAYALGASGLVRFLPTITWYIANRVHFYTERQIPRKTVVAASVFELIALIVSGGALYFVFWLLAVAGGAQLILVGLVMVGLLGAWQGGWVQRWWGRRFGSTVANDADSSRRYQLLVALAWYAGVWLLSLGFFWAVARSLTPVTEEQLQPLINTWMLANLATYLVDLSFGTIPLAREVTLTLLLSQTWSLATAFGIAILVKILFYLGEIGCSAVLLGWLHLTRRKTRPE